jgi:phytol kinase
MIGQILITSLLFLGFIGIIVGSEYLHKRFDLPPELTRKGSHLVATLSSILFPFLIDSHWYILVLGVFFFLLLYIGKKQGLFNSIDGVNRKTGGSYLLPIAIYTSFLASEILDQTLCFVLPMLILAISDSLAGYVGIQYAKKTTYISIWSLNIKKTQLGSWMFFLSAFLITLIVLPIYGYSGTSLIMWTFGIAGIITLVEMLSVRGLDNLTIPWMTILLIWVSTQV